MSQKTIFCFVIVILQPLARPRSNLPNNDEASYNSLSKFVQLLQLELNVKTRSLTVHKHVSLHQRTIFLFQCYNKSFKYVNFLIFNAFPIHIG